MDSVTQRKTILILIAVLLAVVGASTAVLLLLPSDAPAPVVPAAQDEAGQAPVGTGDFNLRTLDRTGYKNLNAGLLQNGLLPVKPPTNVGKANPFL